MSATLTASTELGLSKYVFPARKSSEKIFSSEAVEPRLWVSRSSFKRQRDSNPPKQRAAQHALPVTDRPRIGCVVTQLGLACEASWVTGIANPSGLHIGK